MSYFLWRSNAALLVAYVLAVTAVILNGKDRRTESSVFVYGMLVGAVIEIVGTQVSGYQSFANPDMLGIPFWLVVAWGYGFVLIKRVGLIIGTGSPWTDAKIHANLENLGNEKISVKNTTDRGLGIFAIKDIKKDEVVIDFSAGEIFEAKKASDLPDFAKNHAIQFEECRYIYGIGRYMNHSCEPNCGIRSLFKIVSMRDIREGEELTWDYEMSEDSDWRMECRCGATTCRKTIGAYRNMPDTLKRKYEGYISGWLVGEYREFYGK